MSNGPDTETNRAATDTERSRGQRILRKCKKCWPCAGDSDTSSIADSRYDHFIVEKQSDYPRGYPQLAAHLNSEIDTKLYRRYGYLRNRVILYRQDELASLEQQLARLDAADAARDPMLLCSRAYDEGQENPLRRQLIQEIDDKLREYDDLLRRENRLLSMGRPTRRAHRSLFNHIWNQKPLKQPGTSLDGSFIDVLLALIPRKLVEVFFSKPADERKSDDPDDNEYSNERMDVFVKMIIVSASIGFLMVPIVLLYILNSSKPTRVGIILTFVLAFSSILAFMTKAKLHELFGVTAAYCAVLVVFLGNLPAAK